MDSTSSWPGDSWLRGIMGKVLWQLFTSSLLHPPEFSAAVSFVLGEGITENEVPGAFR